VLTEQTRGWWRYAMRELDYAYGVATADLRAQVPEKPSFYMERNVFLGASFLPPAGVKEALDEGYASRVIWGRDYPHGEGTYRYPEAPGEESMTRASIRWAFAGCPADEARAMLGENGVEAYHLDRDRLAAVADRIGALTPDEVSTPLDDLPPNWVGDIFGQ
jgi:hypothetical protein